MVSEPLDVSGPLAETAGTKIDVKTVQFFELKKDEFVFVVHPSNPVGKLSVEQLRDILTARLPTGKRLAARTRRSSSMARAPRRHARADQESVMGGADYTPG